jgi:ankyrin repeat protein
LIIISLPLSAAFLLFIVLLECAVSLFVQTNLTALMQACVRGFEAIVAELIEFGADTELQNQVGFA